MNRILSALLFLLALSCLAVGLAEDAEPAIPDNLSESDIIGVWRLTTLRIDGSTLSADMIGIDMRYDFREDHTAQGTFVGAIGDNGQAEEPWTLDVDQAVIYVSGSPFLKVRVEDGTLFLLMDEEIAEEAGGDLIFTRVEEP